MMKMHQRTSIDEYATNMEIYEAHFLPEFPRLKLTFREDGFTVHGTKIRYTQITGMWVEKPYYLVDEIKHRQQIFLPLQKKAPYRKVDLFHKQPFNLYAWIKSLFTGAPPSGLEGTNFSSDR